MFVRSISPGIAAYAGLVFSVFALVSCGGGGGDSPSDPADPKKPAENMPGGGNDGEDRAGLPTGLDPEVDLPTVRGYVGGSAPAASGADTVTKAETLNARTPGSLLSTDWYFTTKKAAGSSELMTFKAVTTCSGSTCESSLPDDDDAEVVNFGDVEDLFTDNRSEVTAVLTKRGITLAWIDPEESSEGEGFLGAVLGHSVFGLYEHSDPLEDEDLESYFFAGMAGGKLSGSRPSADVTWTGLMTGGVTAGNYRSHVLQGDAAVSYSSSDSSISVSFTDIVDVEKSIESEKKTPHSVSSISFSGVEVTPSGAFGEKSGSEYIQGGLYGPGNEEVAGVFEKSGVAGAFGANK